MDVSENQNSNNSLESLREKRQNMVRHKRRNQNNNIFTNIFQRKALNLRRAIIHKDLKRLIETTKDIRLWLSAGQRSPLDDFLETGLISDIVKLLDPDDKINVNLQIELIWIVSSACTGSEEQTVKIVTNHMIKKILRFLCHPEQKIVELALSVIANTTGDSNALRKKLLQFNVIGTICKFIKKSEKYSIKENKEFISWILNNFALTAEAHEQFFEYGLLRVIEEFLCLDDDKTCLNACWIYSNMTDRERGDDKYIASILTPKFMARIVQLLELESKNRDILTPAIKTVGNILSSSSHSKIKMYSAGCLDKLEALIEDRKSNIRNEAIWAIVSILIEPTLLDETLQTPLFAKLINTIIIDENSVKLGALLCFIAALRSASQKQVRLLVELGIISAFPDILSSDDKDIIVAGLEVLGSILHHGSQTELPHNPYLLMLEGEGIIQFIEHLQNHPDDEVYEKASLIIDTYL